MRSLRRPMFRYGGNVKTQGVMHGMKNMQDGGPATMADATGYAGGGMTEPQAINTVGSPLAPRDNSGRQGYAIPLLAGIPAAMTALRAARPLAAAGRGIKNFYQGFRGARTTTPGNLGFGGRLKDLAFGQGRFRQPATPKGYDAGFRKGQAPAPLSFKEIISSPTTLGKAAREYPITAAGLTYGALGIPRNIPDIVGAVGTGVKKVGQGIVNQTFGTEFGKEKPPVLKKTPTGDRGSLLKTDSAPKALSKEEVQAKDDARLAKIYKLLGVDKSQRNAASKALVDVSRYIDEGGKDTVSKKNIGSTISKAISSFDKRLDKSDQLKEAAGVMMAKSYLEGGDKAQEREYRQVMIDAKKKEMNPDLSDLKAMYTKSGVTDAAGAAASKKFGSAYGGALMSTKDFNKQLKAFEGEQLEEKTILDIATNAVNNLELAGEGGKVKDGYYKVGTNVVLITDGKAIELVG